ncbi:MAG: zinc-ribbon domain-containing protein [Bacillota bacterium]|nr:zinc-ribbon domain-containing protein [Bacillota bacterium]
MYCPNCGYSNSDNSKFCLKCGTQLAAFVQAEAPVYNPAEQPAYNPYAQPETPMYNSPEQPVYNPYAQPETPMYNSPEQPAYNPYAQPGMRMDAPLAAQSKRKGAGIGAAVTAIIAFLMFFLPWLGAWGFSMNYIDMMDVSGDLGWIVDEAETVSAILIICMVVFSVLAIITIVKGFMGKTSGCGIAAGIIGIIMVLALAIAMEFELEYMGIGAYLFFAASVTLLVLSCKK